MKNSIRLAVLFLFAASLAIVTGCKKDNTPEPITHTGAWIIADHTVVDRFDDIPDEYIDKVKKMLFIPAGESHSNGILGGLTLVEALDSRYNSDQGDGTGGPDPYTNTKLRAERAFWGDYSNASGWITMYGEEDWFTNSTGIARTKAGWDYMHANGWDIAATGLIWCWDMFGSMSTGADPVYGCHWFGATLNGPEGSKPWGLDAADFDVTGNTVCMDTYLNTTDAYDTYCATNGYPTRVFFATGPVDAYGSPEERYQAYLKYEHIRDFVLEDSTRILFDYADILCYNDNGSTATETWNGHTFPVGTSANTLPEQVGHISNTGALRLGKATWWMLARIAGWDGK